MHYKESRNESAEIQRITLEHMQRQPAAFHPMSYTVWYEHAAGINPALSRAIGLYLAESRTLTDVDVAKIYARHIVARECESIEGIRERLLALLQETTQLISSTGTYAVHLNEALQDHSLRLTESTSHSLPQETLSELLAQTRHLGAANAAISQQLDTNTQEVLSLAKRLEQVHLEALNDPITGLLNRRGFERATANLRACTGRTEGSALLALDASYFKCIVGDQVLRAVAQVLRAKIKASDIAARLGGDEFAVLLLDTSLTDALEVADQIHSALTKRRLWIVDGREYAENITISVGVALALPDDRLEDLVERADAALYRAKHSSKSRVWFVLTPQGKPDCGPTEMPAQSTD